MFNKKVTRKPFRRLIAGAAATAALAVVSVVAVATPAMAAPGGCLSGYTCLWKDAGYVTNGNGDNSFSFENGVNDLRNYRWVFNGTVNDNVSSVYNNGNSEASFIFDNLNFQVQLSYFPIKFGKQSLGDGNDRASSAGFRYCLNNPTSSRCQ